MCTTASGPKWNICAFKCKTSVTLPVRVGTFFQTNLSVALPCLVESSLLKRETEQSQVNTFRLHHPTSLKSTHPYSTPLKGYLTWHFPLEQTADCQLWKSLNHKTTLPSIFLKRLKIEENWEGIIQNEVTLGGSPTLKSSYGEAMSYREQLQDKTNLRM